MAGADHKVKFEDQLDYKKAYNEMQPKYEALLKENGVLKKELERLVDHHNKTLAIFHDAGTDIAGMAKARRLIPNPNQQQQQQAPQAAEMPANDTDNN